MCIIANWTISLTSILQHVETSTTKIHSEAYWASSPCRVVQNIISGRQFEFRKLWKTLCLKTYRCVERCRQLRHRLSNTHTNWADLYWFLSNKSLTVYITFTTFISHWTSFFSFDIGCPISCQTKLFQRSCIVSCKMTLTNSKRRVAFLHSNNLF